MAKLPKKGKPKTKFEKFIGKFVSENQKRIRKIQKKAGAKKLGR